MLKKFYIPTKSADDWQRLLAEPEKHWRSGFSAKSLAECWESSNGELPAEIRALFRNSSIPAFQQVDILLAFPEWQVHLPPKGHPSQNDLFVLARDCQGNLISIMVEGKVSEPFGETLADWLKNSTPGKLARLEFIKSKLGIAGELPGSIRYQLLHRTASAILEAERFKAKSAVIIVHSFSQDDKWFEDFAAFLCLFGIPDAKAGMLYQLRALTDFTLYAGWAVGDNSKIFPD